MAKPNTSPQGTEVGQQAGLIETTLPDQAAFCFTSPESASHKPMHHGIVYFVGNGLAMLASAVSLVIMTRLFDPSMYGSLSLIVVTMTVLATLASCGLPQAAVRFFWSAEIQQALPRFYGTQLFGAYLIGVGGFLLLELVVWCFPLEGWLGASQIHLLRLFGPWVTLMIVGDAMQNLLRTLQRPWWFNAFAMWRNWGALVLSLLFLLTVGRRLELYFGGQVLAEVVAVVVGGIGLAKLTGWSGLEFSPGLFWRFLRYGLPHTFVILGNLFLVSGDRYIVRYFLGDASVGIYAAAFSVVSLVTVLLSRPLNLVTFPLYAESWERDGAAATKTLLSRVLTAYTCVALLTCGVFLPIGRDVLLVLTGAKFVAGAPLLFLLFGGLMIQSLFSVIVAGLYVSQQTSLVAWLTFCSVCLNIALNLFLIPRIGLFGAALALFLSSIGQFLLIRWRAFRVLPMTVDRRPLVKATIVAGVLWATMAWLPASPTLLGLGWHIAAAMVIIWVAYLGEMSERLRRLHIGSAAAASPFMGFGDG